MDMIPSPQSGFLRGVFIANHLASNDNLTRTIKTEPLPTKTDTFLTFITIWPASPCAAEFLWNLAYDVNSPTKSRVSNFSSMGSGVTEFGVLIPPKLPFPIDLLRRPYNSVRTAVRHCDIVTWTANQSSLVTLTFDLLNLRVVSEKHKATTQ